MKVKKRCYIDLEFDVMDIVLCYVSPLKFGTDVGDVKHFYILYVKKFCKNNKPKTLAYALHSAFLQP